MISAHEASPSSPASTARRRSSIFGMAAWRLCNPVNASVFAILSSWKLFFRSCRNASEFALFCKDSFLRSVMSR